MSVFTRPLYMIPEIFVCMSVARMCVDIWSHFLVFADELRSLEALSHTARHENVWAYDGHMCKRLAIPAIGGYPSGQAMFR